MNEENFEPRNLLERTLVDLHEGRIDEAEFLNLLPGMEIFMPVKDQDLTNGAQSAAQAHPLVVEGSRHANPVPAQPGGRPGALGAY